MQSVCYYCPTLSKIRPFQQNSLDLPIIKFHENPCSGSEVVTHGQTDMGELTGAVLQVQKSVRTIHPLA
jgi:hypothetical protein